jgi:hypothetical protein
MGIMLSVAPAPKGVRTVWPPTAVAVGVVDLTLIDWVALRVFLSVPSGKQTIEKRLNGQI